jgi:2,3-dihydroxyphenylpropionate 1,2-dioxygenase
LASTGPYRTDARYYRPAAELIAGFAVRTAAPTTMQSEAMRRSGA